MEEFLPELQGIVPPLPRGGTGLNSKDVFDMVVFDPAAGFCEIYEIKHSTEAVPQQYRHLIDEQKCEMTRHRFGPITGKYVLYRGEDMVLENGITYRNVENYLLDLV